MTLPWACVADVGMLLLREKERHAVLGVGGWYLEETGVLDGNG